MHPAPAAPRRRQRARPRRLDFVAWLESLLPRVYVSRDASGSWWPSLDLHPPPSVRSIGLEPCACHIFESCGLRRYDATTSRPLLPVDAVYVLHYSRNTRRLDLQMEQLPRLGVPFTIVAGCDREDIGAQHSACLLTKPTKALPAGVDERFGLHRLDAAYTSQVVKLMSALYDQLLRRLRTALVLEDDAVVRFEHLQGLAEKVKLMRGNFHIVYSGSYNPSGNDTLHNGFYRKDARHVPDDANRGPGRLMPAVGSVVSATGAAHLLRSLPLVAPIDMTLSDTRLPSAPREGAWVYKPYAFVPGAFGRDEQGPFGGEGISSLLRQQQRGIQVVNPFANASLDALSIRALHECQKRRIKAGGLHSPPPLAALGLNFSGGDLRPRGGYWYEPEDGYVFEHFFSASGERPMKRQGTYLELGALDGRLASNTLWFENALQWSGVLVEASPVVFDALRTNRGANPKNVLVNAVVCSEGKVVNFTHPSAWRSPSQAQRVAANAGAGIGSALASGTEQVFGLTEDTAMPCKPLNAILREASVGHIDFFSLDCEGAELMVLETFDPAAVDIDLVMIEQNSKHAVKDSAVRVLMNRYGFKLLGRVGQFCSNELWLQAAKESQYGSWNDKQEAASFRGGTTAA